MQKQAEKTLMNNGNSGTSFKIASALRNSGAI